MSNRALAPLMTAPTTIDPSERARILAKPESVQGALKAIMTKASIEQGHEDFSWLAKAALTYWDEIVATVRAEVPEAREDEIADAVVRGLRKQEVCWKILRGTAS